MFNKSLIAQMCIITIPKIIDLTRLYAPVHTNSYTCVNNQLTFVNIDNIIVIKIDKDNIK